MKKRFWKMSWREKIAFLRGYAIWEDSELATWDDHSIAFYYNRINDVAHITCVIAFLISLLITTIIGYIIALH